MSDDEMTRALPPAGPASGSDSVSRYRFEGTVRKWNHYGDKVVARTPASILASTDVEAQEKARVMFGATYDDFRKFWSHDFTVERVTEAGGSENA